jgi:hypothetical protein
VRKSELAKLHRAVVCGRLAVEAARGELIESLGNWMCGSGSPPGPKDVEALTRLCEAQERIEAEYARCLAVMSDGVIARLRRP